MKHRLLACRSCAVCSAWRVADHRRARHPDVGQSAADAAAPRLPRCRSCAASSPLVESLIIGVRRDPDVGQRSSAARRGESQELSKQELAGTLIVALILAVALFFLAPLFLTGLFSGYLGEGFTFWFVEGLVRVAIFIGYLAIVTRIPDLRRVFEYHGAEHMSIHALEHDEELTPANVEKYKTLHVRCGTSFLLIVMVVSIMVFAFVGRPDWYLLILSRVVLIPLIAGVSYEIIRFAGRYEKHKVVRAIMLPGLMLQWMTTKQPDEPQIEVAIASLERIIELEPRDMPVPKGVEIMA